ncbi:MAG TPA: Hsp20/alpha crystallin family protein [Xanthomonadaceae bacterium]|jgi:HSP20 family protein|nr:Hsp20/alpha crystallin family protein [Xanthomonadaceae bacterium]
MYHFRHLPRLHAWGNVGCNDDMNRAFERFLGENAGSESVAAQWTPRVDIREEAERFVILADIPGVDPKDIEIQMEQNVLSFRGERKVEPAQEGDRWSRRERARGSFERSFTLPDTANADGIEATGRNGVLEISIPKKAQTRARKIEVN